jgi:hypothetical protein
VVVNRGNNNANAVNQNGKRNQRPQPATTNNKRQIVTQQINNKQPNHRKPRRKNKPQQRNVNSNNNVNVNEHVKQQQQP